MKVISVKFKENGRGYYFDPGRKFQVKEGDFVIVTTARGTECGEVVRGAHEVPGFSREVKPVIRVADAVDVRRMRQNRADVQRAFQICEQRIAAHGLKMKLVDAEYTLDRASWSSISPPTTGWISGAGQGPGRPVPHPHRTAPDRRAG